MANNYAVLAELVMRLAVNQDIIGSSPINGVAPYSRLNMPEWESSSDSR
jgi:hypothetical protein